jgi:cell division protein FtsB
MTDTQDDAERYIAALQGEIAELTSELERLRASNKQMREALEEMIEAQTRPFAGTMEHWNDYMNGVIGRARAALKP